MVRQKRVGGMLQERRQRGLGSAIYVFLYFVLLLIVPLLGYGQLYEERRGGVRELQFESSAGDETLGFGRGLLTLPPSSVEGPYPAVLILEMRGAHDLRSTPWGHPVYQDLAEGLAHCGVASLRISSLSHQDNWHRLGVTEETYLLEAQGGLSFLRRHPLVDSGRLGVLGHSFGSLPAMRLAGADSARVRFLILMASPGLDMPSVLLDMKRAELEMANVPLGGLGSLGYLYRSLSKREEPVPHGSLWYRWLVWRASRLERSLQTVPEPFDSIRRDVWALVRSPGFNSLLKEDPEALMGGVVCPVLLLHGKRDSEVLSRENLSVLERVVKRRGGGAGYRKVEFPGLNHLFLPGRTGYRSEYEGIDGYLPDEVIGAIEGWLVDIGIIGE